MAVMDRLMVGDAVAQQADRVGLLVQRPARPPVAGERPVQRGAPEPHLLVAPLTEQGNPASASYGPIRSAEITARTLRNCSSVIAPLLASVVLSFSYAPVLPLFTCGPGHRFTLGNRSHVRTLPGRQ